MQNELFHCDNCGCELTKDTVYHFDGSYFCSECLDDSTCICEHCGDRIWADENSGTDSFVLCECCYDNHYTTCESCGRIIHQDYANYDDDDDYPYCDDCYNRINTSSIHDYGYKPDPLFFGEGNRYFGVELEIDEGGKDSENADQLLFCANIEDEHIYIKSDGSLNDGMEIVTHPMTLDYHKTEMHWDSLCDKAIHLGYRSHKTTTCGLHIHINRSTFGDSRDMQDECISRVLYFVEHHWAELLKFSRRTEYTMNKWAARYGYKNSPKDILNHAKKGENGRYACVNITNWNTIEFRMFRGTLKLNTIIATLELVNKICDLATFLTDEEISNISWTSFVKSLDNDNYAELITYLKERQLYINEPVDFKEDE